VVGAFLHATAGRGAREFPEVSETPDGEAVDSPNGDLSRAPDGDDTGSRDPARLFCDGRRFTTSASSASIREPDRDKSKPDTDGGEATGDDNVGWLATGWLVVLVRIGRLPGGFVVGLWLGELSPGDEDPDEPPADSSSAHAAGAPSDTAAPIPSATASPPTRPTKRPAFMSASPTAESAYGDLVSRAVERPQ
jgi:hypothetical protein